VKSKEIRPDSLQRGDLVLMPDVSDREVIVEEVDQRDATGPVAEVILKDGSHRRVQILRDVRLLWIGNCQT
jgi:hypothetical protein